MSPGADKPVAPVLQPCSSGDLSVGEDDDIYRMNPLFRRFLDVVGPMERALAAWDIAREAFLPSDPDADAQYEVWQNDEMVAGCSGPRNRALAEAVHYAVVYQTEGNPCTITEVTRRTVSPEEAHEIIAAAPPSPHQSKDV